MKPKDEYVRKHNEFEINQMRQMRKLGERYRYVSENLAILQQKTILTEDSKSLINRIDNLERSVHGGGGITGKASLDYIDNLKERLVKLEKGLSNNWDAEVVHNSQNNEEYRKIKDRLDRLENKQAPHTVFLTTDDLKERLEMLEKTVFTQVIVLGRFYDRLEKRVEKVERYRPEELANVHDRLSTLTDSMNDRLKKIESSYTDLHDNVLARVGKLENIEKAVYEPEGVKEYLQKVITTVDSRGQLFDHFQKVVWEKLDVERGRIEKLETQRRIDNSKLEGRIEELERKQLSDLSIVGLFQRLEKLEKDNLNVGPIHELLERIKKMEIRIKDFDGENRSKPSHATVNRLEDRIRKLEDIMDKVRSDIDGLHQYNWEMSKNTPDDSKPTGMVMSDCTWHRDVKEKDIGSSSEEEPLHPDPKLFTDEDARNMYNCYFKDPLPGEEKYDYGTRIGKLALKRWDELYGKK